VRQFHLRPDADEQSGNREQKPRHIQTVKSVIHKLVKLTARPPFSFKGTRRRLRALVDFRRDVLERVFSHAATIMEPFGVVKKFAASFERHAASLENKTRAKSLFV
jgi:hypothetical protein